MKSLTQRGFTAEELEWAVNEKIWPKLKYIPETGCWEWHRFSPGHYPHVRFPRPAGKGFSVAACRVVLLWKTGLLHSDFCALHSCDNTGCVRPDHLSWGTHQQNIAEAVERARIKYRTGETHGKAKYTDDQVREALRLFDAGMLRKQIAAATGIGYNALLSICKGRTWGHLRG